MHDADEAGGTTPAQKNRRIHIPGVLLVMALWGLCLGWQFLQPSPERVEAWYSRGFYRFVVALITPVTSAVPFSIVLALIVSAPVLFLLLWVCNWVYRKRVLKKSHWRGLLWGPKWLLVIVPVVWLWFLVFWGMGYGRLPVEKRLNFDNEKVSEAELLHIKNSLLDIIVENVPQHSDDRDVDRAIAAVARSMQALVTEWEGRPIRLPHRVKATPPGLLLMNGTSGICVPFTLEPHVDGGLPDTWFVSVGAHELGHIAGVCDEGETNLIGYIAGLRAEDAYARYAVALDVYLDIARQLGADVRKAAIEQLPEQARQDLERVREAQARYRIDWFQKWSWRAYNQYLKSQGVREGVQSYGRGVQLLAQAWRAGHFEFPEMPVLREGEVVEEPEA